jgi:magnesium-transporting ATPase (P-type)
MTETPESTNIIAYQQPAAEVAAALGIDSQRGLSTAEAQARLKRYGRNELAAEPPIPAWRKFLLQFQNVLVILLIIATIISAAVWLYEREAALPFANETNLGDRTNMLFSGTAATYGRGRAIVTETGMRTEMGKIAGLLQHTRDDETPLQQELDRTGRILLLWWAILLSLLLHVLVVYLPFLQVAFGTTTIGLSDWLLCALVGSSVLWLRELSKAVMRQRAPGGI